jgi:uncharacterized pyridoxal phosphate-containing UPF0001 family protein
MVQVNTSDETQKGGVTSDDETLQLAQYIDKECSGLNLSGFMTIGSIEQSNRDDDCNNDYEKLFNIRRMYASTCGRDEKLFQLSMGMSADYQMAIRVYGSTSVRVGSTIFGARIESK